MRLRLLSLLLFAWAVAPSSGLVAQDVELLWAIHGNRPPDAYFEERDRSSEAYRFQSEGLGRLRELRESGPTGPAAARPAASALRSAAATLGPRDGPVAGVFRFPLVLGNFADGPQDVPFTVQRVQEEFFDGPNSYHQTIPEFYTEMSGGIAELVGVAHDWVSTGLTGSEVTLGASGLSRHLTLGVGAFIESIVQALDDEGVDWSEFDNTGDGFVDILTVMHPFQGAECTGGGPNLIGSHRWTLERVTEGRLSPGFETSTPRPGGPGNIYINSYTIQPLLSCGSDPTDAAPSINRIGTYAHELGHGFGLPDLYDTSRGGPRHWGVGYWDLMGTGNWGCRGSDDPSRPCHMGAWSKAMLGWLDLEEISPGEYRSVRLEPVQSSRRALKIPASDGSREYLLLENRQRIGSDGTLYEPGLLIWHVDQDVLDARWSTNTVNNNADRMGVRLLQADGRNHLGIPSGGNRGDRGDPFPGCFGSESPILDPEVPCEGTNTAFHMGTDPAAFTHQKRGMGIALSGIELVGGAPYDVAFELDTRFTRDSITIFATAEAVKPQHLVFEVEGAADPLIWRVVDGAFPSGFQFDEGTGSLTGLTYEAGEFEFSLSIADGAHREIRTRVALQVEPPGILADDLVAVFLGKADPLPQEFRTFLEHLVPPASYHLGHVRAYLQANPESFPGSAPPIQRVVIPAWGDPSARERP